MIRYDQAVVIVELMIIVRCLCCGFGYTLQFLRYSPDKIFKLKVTTARKKVKSRSHHDVALKGCGVLRPSEHDNSIRRGGGVKLGLIL